MIEKTYALDEATEAIRHLAEQHARAKVVIAVLQRRDGSSVYEQPDRQRWALRVTLDQEAWVLVVAAEPTGHTPQSHVIETAIVEHDPGGDQSVAVRELLGSERRLGRRSAPLAPARPAPCAPWCPPGSTAEVRCSG